MVVKDSLFNLVLLLHVAYISLYEALNFILIKKTMVLVLLSDDCIIIIIVIIIIIIIILLNCLVFSPQPLLFIIF